MHLWATAVGTLLIVVILWDAFQTIILSRRVSRRFRPTRGFYRLLWTPWRAFAKRVPQGNRRENLLTVFGPLSLILLIALWALGLIGSFALLHWGLGSRLTDPDGHAGFGVDLYMSGTTFFTLGLGDVTPRTTLARGLTVLECGMGFAFLALVIGYVPLISQAFSRREVSISMIDARAGSPPFELAVRDRVWHVVEHASFLTAGLLFWWPVVLPWPSRGRWPAGALILYLVLADVQNTALAAILTFSDRVLYPIYGRGPRALEEQVIAGLLMWVPMALAYLVPAGVLTVRWLSPATLTAASPARP